MLLFVIEGVSDATAVPSLSEPVTCRKFPAYVHSLSRGLLLNVYVTSDGC
jgi:hypothetical protein